MPGQVEVAGASACFASVSRATILEGDRLGLFKRGCRQNRRRIAGGWDAMVSGAWRHVAITPFSIATADNGAILTVGRARAERSPARPRARSSRDCAATGALGIDDFTRATT